jgi:hypothetical protein
MAAAMRVVIAIVPVLHGTANRYLIFPGVRRSTIDQPAPKERVSMLLFRDNRLRQAFHLPYSLVGRKRERVFLRDHYQIASSNHQPGH